MNKAVFGGIALRSLVKLTDVSEVLVSIIINLEAVISSEMSLIIQEYGGRHFKIQIACEENGK
jgi:hypothetical protein